MGSELWELDRVVLRCVRKIGDPLLEHIIQGVANEMTAHTAEARVKHLIRQNYLRMKDDDIDHDWAYVLTADGRRALEGTNRPRTARAERERGEQCTKIGC